MKKNNTEEKFCEKLEVLGDKKLVKECKDSVKCQADKCKKEVDNLKKVRSKSKMDKIREECVKKYDKVEDVGLCILKKTPKKVIKEIEKASLEVMKCSNKKCKKEMSKFTKTMVSAFIKKAKDKKSKK